MEAELFYPFADVTQLGQAYSVDTPDNTDKALAEIVIENNTAVSIYAHVTMKTTNLDHFAQFKIAGVFSNKGGVMTEKYQSDTVTNRDNEQNKFYFVIDGTTIKIYCNSGLNIPALWSGMVAVIAV